MTLPAGPSPTPVFWHRVDAPILTITAGEAAPDAGVANAGESPAANESGPQPRTLQIIAADGDRLIHSLAIEDISVTSQTTLPESLPAGAYEICLRTPEPSSPSWSRFWRRDGAAANPETADRWPLIVTAPANVGADASTDRWDGGNHLIVFCENLVDPPLDLSMIAPKTPPRDRLVSWRKASPVVPIGESTRIWADRWLRAVNMLDRAHNARAAAVVWPVAGFATGRTPVQPSDCFADAILHQAASLGIKVHIASQDPRETADPIDVRKSLHDRFRAYANYGGPFLDLASLEPVSIDSVTQWAALLSQTSASASDDVTVTVAVPPTWNASSAVPLVSTGPRGSGPPESGPRESTEQWLRAMSSTANVRLLRRSRRASSVSLAARFPRPTVGGAAVAGRWIGFDGGVISTADWLSDWASFLASGESTLLIDGEALLDADAERAIAVWVQHGRGHRHLLNRPSGSLVQLLQFTGDSGSTLVLINLAPWEQTVTMPGVASTSTESTVAWTAGEVDSVVWTQPVSTPGGLSLTLPPRGFRTCRSLLPLQPIMVAEVEIAGGATRLDELKRQVTAVVERQGLLGELGRIQRPGTADRAPSSAKSRLSLDRLSPASMVPLASTALQQIGLGGEPAVAEIPVDDSSNALESGDPIGAPEANGDLIRNGDFEIIPPRRVASEMATPEQAIHGNGPAVGALSELAGPGLPIPSGGVWGWMHAQHPRNAVGIDDTTAFSGRRSVRMMGQDPTGSQSWLISSPMTTPKSGRLAVALAVRAVSQGDEPATLRIAVEGHENGKPCRHGVTIQVPGDGRWQSSRTVLEWVGLSDRTHGDLKLTLDNLSTATIWIDNVTVSDWFASQNERADLQSLAYLAVQGLQKNDLTATAAFLQNFWAGELLRSKTSEGSAAVERSGAGGAPFGGGDIWSDKKMPLSPAWKDDSTDRASAIGPDAPPDRVDAGEAEAGMAARLRRWLPEPLRF